MLCFNKHFRFDDALNVLSQRLKRFVEIQNLTTVSFYTVYAIISYTFGDISIQKISLLVENGLEFIINTFPGGMDIVHRSSFDTSKSMSFLIGRASITSI